MEISTETVKNIKISTSYWYREYNDRFYNDSLSINKDGVSYIRDRNEENERVIEWSYKDITGMYTGRFDRVVYSLKNTIKDDLLELNQTSNDRNSFNILIEFNDNSIKEYKFRGSFASNGLIDLASAIIQIIPNGHSYPDLINLFIDKRLKTSALSKINKENLVALMFAEGGAMGSPGQTEIITYDYKKYVRYSGNALFDEDVNQYKVFELFDGLFDDKNLIRKSFQILTINNSNWVYLNLGFGNHLFLEEHLWEKVWNIVFHQEKGYRYGGWGKLVRSE